jgi:hypothetical protein
VFLAGRMKGPALNERQRTCWRGNELNLCVYNIDPGVVGLGDNGHCVFYLVLEAISAARVPRNCDLVETIMTIYP